MHVSKGTKYIAANTLLVALAFIALQYFSNANGPHSGSENGKLVFLGIILYLLASMVIIIRAFYRKQRFQFLDKTPLHTAVTAEGLLGAERLKSSTFNLHVSKAAFQNLLTTGQLTLKPEAFNAPIRRKDQIQVHTGDTIQSGYMLATIADIDGYNQKVIITRNQ